MLIISSLFVFHIILLYLSSLSCTLSSVQLRQKNEASIRDIY